MIKTPNLNKIIEYLQNEGALNKQYDSNIDGLVDAIGSHTHSSADINVDSDLVPTTDNSISLGSSTNNYANIYAIKAIVGARYEINGSVGFAVYDTQLSEDRIRIDESQVSLYNWVYIFARGSYKPRLIFNASTNDRLHFEYNETLGELQGVYTDPYGNTFDSIKISNYGDITVRGIMPQVDNSGNIGWEGTAFNVGYFYNLYVNNHLLYDPSTNAVNFTIGFNSMYPNTDNTYSIGTSTNRVASIYAVNVYTGDIHLQNGWRIVEYDNSGEYIDGVRILNSDGKEILKVTEDGLYFKGKKIA